MSVAIRAEAGDWGAVRLEHVEAVAVSAARSLGGLRQDEPLAVVVRVVAGDAPPRALSSLNSAGEFVVEVNVLGPHWAQLAYQFTHEYCHVLANSTTFRPDRFSWFEEALCETASLFALRRMALSWSTAAPFPYWRDYAPHLLTYAAERITDPTHNLQAEATVKNWLPGALPLLERDLGRRAEQAIVANELLRVFESSPRAWRAIRSLHDAPRPAQASLEEYLSGWYALAPEADRNAVREISRALV